MKGEKVKRILVDAGYNLNSIANKLGISPQNFQKWLSVQDMKTGILEKIATAIDKDIFSSLKKREPRIFMMAMYSLPPTQKRRWWANSISITGRTLPKNFGKRLNF